MAEIEDDIRRRLIAERQQQLEVEQRQAQQFDSETAPVADSDRALLNRPADGNGWTPGLQPSQQADHAQQQQAPYYAHPPQVLVLAPERPGTLQKWKAKGGILGAIASVLLFLLKVGAPILAVLAKLKFLAFGLKFLLTGGSMLLSMWLYAKLFGWPFGVGIVMLIFVHECGHAFAAHRTGFKYGYMLFVPLMGAFVTMKGYGRSLVTDAYIGIMGLIVGTVGSVLVGLMYVPTHNTFWLALAQWGFFINLFNLLPTPPLDGGWISPLFSPKLLAIGAVIAVGVGFMNPLIWLLLLVSIPRIISGWKAAPKTQPFYQVSPADKWRYGAVYLGLAAFLALGGYYVGSVIRA